MWAVITATTNPYPMPAGDLKVSWAPDTSRGTILLRYEYHFPVSGEAEAILAVGYRLNTTTCTTYMPKPTGRPILEFVSVLWRPYQDYLIVDIERVQNRFLRFIAGQIGMPVDYQNHDYTDSRESSGAYLCQEFTKGASLNYRTHLFFMEYEYNFFSPFDVVLVTQCSANRMSFLEEISKNWPGSISVALYFTDNEVQSFVKFVQNSESLRKRKNIAYHIVYKEGEFYPVNYLRNVAMSHISTPFAFQMDIDFIPHIGLLKSFTKYIEKYNITRSSMIAIVVPAFETQRYRFTFPKNKKKLILDLNKGLIYTFRYHVWSQGHAATNYSFWKKASTPYEVSWQPDYEPYIVVPSSAPKYDIRFIGFGWNKVSYITHLTAIGYKYLVLPDTFIIHRPHAPSEDIAKFRTSHIYRRIEIISAKAISKIFYVKNRNLQKDSKSASRA
ncbi:xylosyl- and glucuronyltransferase LARGE2s-like [Leptopilina boulardi]|uniref:xylosyl- and glucuronyltransferase LARGE2s-like n=1 Tax=Leptopilina boulardi TaxID=63433 RepID=UPI0021F5B805|nr:xylosyl- and glucuronyltransferase LARGE2s-like [Leptopilina boulardi]